MISEGYCHCGCGQKTSVCTHTDNTKGYKKGQHRRYIAGHHKRKYRDPLEGPNPSGFCWCGCGERTSISRRAESRDGVKVGQYCTFCSGHQHIVKPRSDNLKYCTSCKRDKPREEFYKSNTSIDGKKSHCAECLKERTRLYYKKNQEERKNYSRKYYQAHLEEYTSYNKEYRQKELEYFREHARYRRALEVGARGNYTKVQWEARINFFGRRCFNCGCNWDTLVPNDQTVEHMIPLSRGGSNWPSNLRPACRSCNSKKRTKDWRLFAKLGLRFSLDRAGILKELQGLERQSSIQIPVWE